MVENLDLGHGIGSNFRGAGLGVIVESCVAGTRGGVTCETS